MLCSSRHNSAFLGCSKLRSDSSSKLFPALNLIAYLCALTCALYLLQRFAAVIMRIREPKTTALIFQSGKMVSSSLPTRCKRQDLWCMAHSQ